MKTLHLAILFFVLTAIFVSFPNAVLARDTSQSTISKAEVDNHKAGKLPPQLRQQLRKQALEYKEEYRGAGSTSTVKIHWPTVLLVLVVILVVS